MKIKEKLKRYVLLSTTECTKCPPAKEFMLKTEFEGKFLDAIDNDEGSELALEHKIQAVPTILLFDEDNNLLAKTSSPQTELEEILDKEYCIL